jgi:hypothetical protein
MRAVRIGLASALVGCAPAEDELDLPIEVCGQDEPVQILALEDEQVIDPAGGAARYGDRWLFGVKTFEIPLTKVDNALSGSAHLPYRQMDAAIVATGECGEDPRVVAEGLDVIAPRRRDTDPWLGCKSQTWGTYWFDPDGAWSPRLVDAGLFCLQYLIVDQTVIFYGGNGELARARLEADEVVIEVLLGGIRSGESVTEFEEDPPDDLVFVREDDTVVAVDLRTGDVTTLAEGIPNSFSISPNRRWLVWFEEIDEGLHLRSWLRDLTTGVDTSIGHDEWESIEVELEDSFLLVRGHARWTSLSTQRIALPSQEAEWLDGRVFAADGYDGRILLQSVDSEEWVLDTESGERRPFDVDYDEYADGVLWSRHAAPYADIGLPEAFLPWDVVGMPLDTLEPEITRERVFSSVDLAGDRWVVGSDPDENELVELHYLEGATLEHRAFASDVVPGALDVRSDASVAAPWRTDDMIYQVHTRASDRTGVWRVRFGAP